jgi:hypothetical protein
MSPAVPGEPLESGRVAAPFDDLRPLAGPPIVVQTEAGNHHPAVDDTGRKHSELTADGARHRLVEQPLSLCERPAPRGDKPLEHETEGLEIVVAVLTSELAHVSRLLEHAVPVSGPLPQHRADEREVAVFPTCGVAVEQVLRLREPAARDRHIEANGVVYRQEDCDEAGAPRVIRAQVGLICPFLDPEGPLVLVRPEERFSEKDEVVRRFRLRQKCRRSFPLVPGERLAAVGDHIGRPRVHLSRWRLDQAELQRHPSKRNAAAFPACFDSELVVEMQQMLLHRRLRHDQLSGHRLHRGRLRDDVLAEQRSAQGAEDVALAARQILAGRYVRAGHLSAIVGLTKQ